MFHPRHLLTAAPPPAPLVAPPYSDMAIVMAGLLCGLICVLGLMSVTRCAWLFRRRHPTGVDGRDAAAGDGGLKRKAIESLPKLTFKAAEKGTAPPEPAAEAVAVAECVICLAEFGDGDQIRVLPGCSHVFHVKCIDTWLGAHSSCPSCRQRLVVGRLQKCGGAAGDPPLPQVAGFLP